jgi:hypothetical protein
VYLVLALKVLRKLEEELILRSADGLIENLSI